MRKQLLFAFLGVLTCYSCSNSYDLLENDMELARAAEDYELSTRAISEEEGDTVKIETIADEQTIQALMDEYEQEIMNRQSVAKERVMRTAYATTTDVVGVFKSGSCGTYKELHLYIDAEDTKQHSYVEGSVGDSYVTSNGNVVFKFCLTEANRYYPGGVFLVNHISYSLGGKPMSVYVRYHDCDDKHNKNSISFSNHPAYQSLNDISQGHTVIDKNAALAWAYPPYPLGMWDIIPGVGPRGNIEFGLLAAGVSMGDTRRGRIHVDDEDSSNKNWFKQVHGSTQSAGIGIDVGKNTDYYVFFTTDKVKNNPYYPKFNSGTDTPQ